MTQTHWCNWWDLCAALTWFLCTVSPPLGQTCRNLVRNTEFWVLSFETLYSAQKHLGEFKNHVIPLGKTLREQQSPETHETSLDFWFGNDGVWETLTKASVKLICTN